MDDSRTRLWEKKEIKICPLFSLEKDFEFFRAVIFGTFLEKCFNVFHSRPAKYIPLNIWNDRIEQQRLDDEEETIANDIAI